MAGNKDEDARAKIESFLREATPAQRKMVERLRRLVKGAAPELEERMRWHQVGYLVSNTDVCGIYPSSDHVNLSFMRGATMADPKGFLEGTGKGMRHIKVYKLEDIGEDTIRAYVRQAVASVQSSRTSHSC